MPKSFCFPALVIFYFMLLMLVNFEEVNNSVNLYSKFKSSSLKPVVKYLLPIIAELPMAEQEFFAGLMILDSNTESAFDIEKFKNQAPDFYSRQNKAYGSNLTSYFKSIEQKSTCFDEFKKKKSNNEVGNFSFSNYFSQIRAGCLSSFLRNIQYLIFKRKIWLFMSLNILETNVPSRCKINQTFTCLPYTSEEMKEFANEFAEYLACESYSHSYVMMDQMGEALYSSSCYADNSNSNKSLDPSTDSTELLPSEAKDEMNVMTSELSKVTSSSISSIAYDPCQTYETDPKYTFSYYNYNSQDGEQGSSEGRPISEPMHLEEAKNEGESSATLSESSTTTSSTSNFMATEPNHPDDIPNDSSDTPDIMPQYESIDYNKFCENLVGASPRTTKSMYSVDIGTLNSTIDLNSLILKKLKSHANTNQMQTTLESLINSESLESYAYSQVGLLKSMIYYVDKGPEKFKQVFELFNSMGKTPDNFYLQCSNKSCFCNNCQYPINFNFEYNALSKEEISIGMELREPKLFDIYMFQTEGFSVFFAIVQDQWSTQFEIRYKTGNSEMRCVTDDYRNKINMCVIDFAKGYSGDLVCNNYTADIEKYIDSNCINDLRSLCKNSNELNEQIKDSNSQNDCLCNVNCYSPEDEEFYFSCFGYEQNILLKGGMAINLENLKDLRALENNSSLSESDPSYLINNDKEPYNQINFDVYARAASEDPIDIYGSSKYNNKYLITPMAEGAPMANTAMDSSTKGTGFEYFKSSNQLQSSSLLLKFPIYLLFASIICLF